MATQRIKNKDGEWVLVNNGGGGSTSDIIVDSELSSESTNPIQNKVVTESLKNRQELLEIRYYFGEKELTEEDKAINAASISTYVTNGQKNLYKFFIQNEFRCILESTVHFEDANENGEPLLVIIFDDLYTITAISDAKNILPFIVILDRNGNIINSYELDGPMNSILVIGEDESNAIEVLSKFERMINPTISPYRPLSVHRKISNGNTPLIHGITIAPIEAALPLPSNEPIVLNCIMEDGFVHQIKLDRTTGFIIEDKIKDSSSIEEEPKILGSSVESDMYILNKYSVLDFPPLIVADGLGGGTTIGGYGKLDNGTYYYTYINQLGNIYRKEFTEDKTTTMLLNRDAVYLFDNMQEGDDYALLNTVSLASNRSSLGNLIMPEPVICYKIAAVQGGAGTLQAIPIYPLRVETLARTENNANKIYYKYTILGDNFNTIEVWEVSPDTGVSVLLSTTPFADILGLGTNA